MNVTDYAGLSSVEADDPIGCRCLHLQRHFDPGQQEYIAVSHRCRCFFPRDDRSGAGLVVGDVEGLLAPLGICWEEERVEGAYILGRRSYKVGRSDLDHQAAGL